MYQNTELDRDNSGIVFIPPLPERGGGYTVLPLSVCPSIRPRYFSLHFSELLTLIFNRLYTDVDKRLKIKQDEL
jgi:hypothetical protein